MIEFNVKKIKIGLDFSFFAVLAFCFFIDRNGTLLMSVAACILHEIGHLFMMLILDIEIRSLCFFGIGIKLGCDIRRASFRRSMVVLTAGSAANMIACAFSILLGAYSFAAINLVLGVFNLLCIGDLDGKQIVSIVSERWQLPAASAKFPTLLSYVIVIFLGAFCGDNIGITFYLTLIYMLLIRR